MRLKDVANVVLGADNYDARVTFDGINSVVLAVNTAPNSNLIDVLARINKVFPQIINQLPEGLEGKVVYDSSKFVNSAINEVESTLTSGPRHRDTGGVRCSWARCARWLFQWWRSRSPLSALS